MPDQSDIPETKKEELFESSEEDVSTYKAFLSKPPEDMSLDELYGELKRIQGTRLDKVKRKKAREKKEKEAKWMVDMLSALPEAAREEINKMPMALKKATLKKIQEQLIAAKVAKAAVEQREEPDVAKA